MFLALLRRLRAAPLRTWPTLQLSVAEASAVYMLAFLGSAALGVLRQILLNARFGLGPEAAAYYAAARLPETVGLLVAGGALTNAIVPVLLRVQARSGEAAAQRLLGLTMGTLLGLAAPLGLAAALAAPWLSANLLAPGLDPAAQALAAQLSRVMLLEVLLLVTEAVLAALLVSRNQVLLPALAIALRNLTLIGGTLAAFAFPQVGIYGPTVGAILDALLQILILLPGLRQRGLRLRLAWAPGDRDLRAVLGLLGPNALSGLLNYAGGLLDIAAASLAGARALGAYQNAWLLIGLPIRLLGIAVGQALLPRVAALGVAGATGAERGRLRRVLGRTGLIAVGLAALAGLALAGLSRPLVGLLFERGAFDAAAADLTAWLLALYTLGLPAYVLTEVAGRALIGLADTRTPLLANLAQLGLRAGLLWALLPALGPAAIPIAFAVSSLAEAAILVSALAWRVRAV